MSPVHQRSPAVRRPSLLITSKAYLPVIGGVEETVAECARAASKEFAVTVLVVSHNCQSSTQVAEGCRIIRVGRLAKIWSAPLSAGYLPAFLKLAPRAELIHLHTPYPPAELAALFIPSRIPLVVTYHLDIVRQRLIAPVYQPLLQQLLARSRYIIVSNPVLAQTSPQLRRHQDKIVVIPPGLDLTKFALSAAEQNWVSTMRRDARKPVVLFIGRLVYYKGVDILLQAAARVDAQFVIIGDGPLRPKLQRQADELGLSERITFLSHQPQRKLICYLHSCDVFVLPSVARSETFGLVLIEAMACQKPVISTELGTGTSWVNQHQQTGLVVPAGDPTALASAIQELISNPALARTYGIAAYARAQQVFSHQQFADKLLTLYHQALQ